MIDFWKFELLVDWCLYDDMMGVQSMWSIFELVESVFEVCKFEFQFEWVEGYDKSYWKNSYLPYLNSSLDDLKFIGKFF